MHTDMEQAQRAEVQQDSGGDHRRDVPDRHNHTTVMNRSSFHERGAEPAQKVKQEISTIVDSLASVLRDEYQICQETALKDSDDASMDVRATLEIEEKPNVVAEVAAQQCASREAKESTTLQRDLSFDHGHAPARHMGSPSTFNPPFEPDMEELAPLTAPASVVDSEGPRIQAFAKLEFDNGDYYMNTYSVVLGRDKAIPRLSLKRDQEENTPADSRRPLTTSSEVPSQESGKGDGIEGGSVKTSVINEIEGNTGIDTPNPGRRRKRRSKKSRSTKSSSSRISSTVPKDYTNYADFKSLANADDSANPLNSLPGPEIIPLIAINDHIKDTTPIRFTTISREHALIGFNFDKHLFEVTILGRNGAFIDGVWYPKHDVHPLKNGSVLQIGGAEIRFSLPDVAIGETGAETVMSSSSVTEDRVSIDEREERSGIANGNEHESSGDAGNGNDEDVSDDEDEEEEVASEEDRKAVKRPVRSKLKTKGKSKAKPKAKSKAKPRVKSKVKAEPSPKPSLDLDPSLPVPKRRGPGRPPKNGIISKREQALQARQARDAAKAAAQKDFAENGTGKSDKSQTGINVEDAPLQPITTKRKYTKRKSKDPQAGERRSDGASTEHTESAPPEIQGLPPKPPKEKKPPKPPRSPSPVYDQSTMTPEQLAKPHLSYIVMIHDAISDSPIGAMSLPQIYRAIERRFPYYKLIVETTGWQSSVRHNLSQNAAFRKIAREGKGWMWGLDPSVSVDKEKKKKATPPPAPQQQFYQGHMVQHPYGYQGMPQINGQIPHHMPYSQYGMPPGYLHHPISGHLPPHVSSGLPLPLANAHANSSATYQSPYQSAPPIQSPQQPIISQNQSAQQPQSQASQQPSQQGLISQQQNPQQPEQQTQTQSFQQASPSYTNGNSLNDTNQLAQKVQTDQTVNTRGSTEYGANASNFQNPQSTFSSYPHQPNNSSSKFPNHISQDVSDAISRFKNGFIRQMEDKIRGELLVDSAINRTLGIQTTSSISETEEDQQEIVLMQHLSRMLDDLKQKTIEAQRQVSQPSSAQISPILTRSYPTPSPMYGPQAKLVDPIANHHLSGQQSIMQQNLQGQINLTSPPSPLNNASQQNTGADLPASNPTIKATTDMFPKVEADAPIPTALDGENEFAGPEPANGTKRMLEQDPESAVDLGEPNAKRLAIG